MIRACQGLFRAVREIAQELRDIVTLQELGVDLLIIFAGCGMLAAIVYAV